MLKPDRKTMINKLEKVYRESFSGGESLVKGAGAKSKKKIEAHDPSGKPIINWFPKDFMFYFAECYRKEFELEYNLSYESDLKVINQFAKYFKSIGADYRYHTKSFIDWAFVKKDDIISKKGYITLLTMKLFINEYIQEIILELKTDNLQNEIYDFVSDLGALYDSKHMLSALKRYGIPIVATYLNFHKLHSINMISENIKKMDVDDDDLIRIARSSIIRSPYMQDMLLLEWRDTFKKKFEFCCHESWWRDVDYNGTPHKSYEDLIL